MVLLNMTKYIPKYRICERIEFKSYCSVIPSWMRNRDRENEISNRISNGFDAKAPIPWQVHIYINAKRKYGVKCGGTILNEDTILTAAHCFSVRPKGIYLRSFE